MGAKPVKMGSAAEHKEPKPTGFGGGSSSATTKDKYAIDAEYKGKTIINRKLDDSGNVTAVQLSDGSVENVGK
jgi:hypothetical protein